MGRFYKNLFKGNLDKALGPSHPDLVSPADEKLPPGVAAVAPPAVVAPGVAGAAV